MAYLTESGVKKLLSEIKARLDKKMDSEAGHGTVVMVDTWSTSAAIPIKGTQGTYWYTTWTIVIQGTNTSSTDPRLYYCTEGGDGKLNIATWEQVTPSKYDLYVDTTNNKAYRWDGSKMVEINASTSTE